MIVRPAPGPIRYHRDPLWERSKEFRGYVELLLNDQHAKLRHSLTDAQHIAIEAEAAARRWPDFTRNEYRSAIERAMNETRPRIVAPVSDTPTQDVCDAWRQPEAQRLWQRVISPLAVTRQCVPSLQFTLGVMLAASAMRATPHILHARELLLNNEMLLGLVEELGLGCEGIGRSAPEPRSYEQVIRHLPRLSEGLAAEVHITLAEIRSQFSSWGIPVGQYLAVDGSLVPAWAQQRGARVDGVWSEELEQRLRRRTPEAGFVVHSHEYRPDGLDERDHAANDGPRRRHIGSRVRGYGLTALVDIATGMVLAFDLRDATKVHEPRVLREVLLPTLVNLSPELTVSAIVGDAKYDDDPTHEFLETHYGVHLVAGRKRHAFDTRGILLREATPRFHRSVLAVRGDGIAICRLHGLPMRYAGLDMPSRDGLHPGEPTNARRYRSRFTCSDGCGKVSIATSLCWSNLPYFPHTPYGRLFLFALRRALLHRRNQVEAAFSAIQVGYKQSLDGAARIRVFDRTVNEALLALAIVTRALLLLHSERLRRGETVPPAARAASG